MTYREGLDRYIDELLKTKTLLHEVLRQLLAAKEAEAKNLVHGYVDLSFLAGNVFVEREAGRGGIKAGGGKGGSGFTGEFEPFPGLPPVGGGGQFGGGGASGSF